MGVEAIIGGSALVGAAGSYFGGKAEQKGIKSGMDAQERIAQRNLEFQKEQAKLQRGDFAPWRDMGEEALDKLWEGIQTGAFDVGDIDVTKDPGYQFRMEQGLRAQDASASARGNMLSGAQQKSLARYGQGLASQEYGQAYARQSQEQANKFNMYSGMSQAGQAAAAGQAGASSRLASNVGTIYGNLGNAMQSGYEGIGGARSDMYGGIATSANKGIQNWLTYDKLK